MTYISVTTAGEMRREEAPDIDFTGERKETAEIRNGHDHRMYREL
jgi:hypothetical protein